MTDVFDVILPVFGLIAVGYAAAWVRLLGEQVADGLATYILNIAVPALIFMTLGRGELPEASPWGLWFAYFLGVAVAWGGAAMALKGVLGKSGLEAVLGGCSAAYSNTVLLGIPLVITAFGEAGAVPLFLLLSVHLPAMTVTTVVLAEAASGAQRPRRRVIVDTARSIALNPIIIALAFAAVWRLAGLGVPVLAEKIIAPIASSAVPAALVAMGVTVHRYGFGKERSALAVVLAGKLLVHPLVVWLLASQVFDLPPVWTAVATLFAAAPSGINSYIFANHYRAGIGVASGAIALGTGVSLFTVAAALSWLTSQ